MKQSILKTVALAASVVTLSNGFANADDWFVSKFGKEDTIGHANYLTPDKAKEAAKLVTKGKV